MAKILSVVIGKAAVYVNFDDGSQSEYSGTLDDFKLQLQRDAEKSDSLATSVALLNDMKANPDPSKKCDVIGKVLESAVTIDGVPVKVDVAVAIDPIVIDPITEVKLG